MDVPEVAMTSAPETKYARLATQDPRPSLEERYATREVYVDAVRRAANDLVQQRPRFIDRP